ncbi:energy transducer TonB [Nevskia ramosa]|uniref:energy transducer TonB n=1 Tax=Nevskia ramosa TaxID=64002 RepID=UPI0023560217
MSTIAIQEHGYQCGQRMSARGRVVAAIVVIGLHLGGFTSLLIARSEALPAPEPVVMQVTMIAEAPVVMIEPPPPPPEPVKPKPQPRLMATAKPTPSAIVTPPPDDEPVTEAVAEEPSPPAPPAAPASSPPAEPAIVPPNFVAAYLNNPAPVYPFSAKQRGESGTVFLRVLVTTEGVAGNVTIEKSSGSSSLDNAGRDIVFKRWRFVPAKRGDQKVEAWVIVPIEFKLKA